MSPFYYVRNDLWFYFSYYYYIKFCFTSFYSIIVYLLYYYLEIKSYDIAFTFNYISNKNIYVCAIIGKLYYLKFEGQNITSETFHEFSAISDSVSFHLKRNDSLGSMAPFLWNRIQLHIIGNNWHHAKEKI